MKQKSISLGRFRGDPRRSFLDCLNRHCCQMARGLTGRWLKTQLVLSAAIMAVWGSIGNATPPNYSTFGREQRIDYAPDANELLRIWMVFVDQGDGLIIQLPEKYNYDPDPDDIDSTRSERVDILIDGGSEPKSESWRMKDFFSRLYDGDTSIVEYAIITHHDQDHVAGLINLLASDGIFFQTIYHNGLASYAPGHRNFPSSGNKPDRAVSVSSRGNLVRGMAFLNASGQMEDSYLISNLSDLRLALSNGDLEGVYDNLATGVSRLADSNGLLAFDRVFVGAPFILLQEQSLNREISGLSFDVLWPPEKLQPYGGRDWAETINGNSVTFRLKYGDFEMLFTGDHNEESEKAMMAFWDEQGRQDMLECDVLKVPHHGSAHAYEPFFDGSRLRPVISIASMGEKGFRSKAMNSRNWQHPSTEVIQWLGGAHRFYTTFVQEQRFKWPDIDTEAERQALIERSHILIETDGIWFRLVELPSDGTNLNQLPSVEGTRRGDGTRWIRAKTGE